MDAQQRYGGPYMTGVAVTYEPFAPGFARDPYPEYERMREHAPVYESAFGVWMLFAHADVQRFLTDPGLSVEDRHAAPNALTQLQDEVLGEKTGIGADRSMLDRDPPD